MRYVGGGNKPARIGMSSRMSNVSLDDMHDDDARSIAASSHMSSHLSVNRSLTCKDSALRRAAFEISRESSKESSNSESDDHIEKPKEILRSRISQSSMSSDTSRLSQRSEPSRSATPPLSLSPTQRRLRMVKSFSQDASHEGTVPTEMTGSVSEGALHTTLLHRVKGSKPVLDEVGATMVVLRGGGGRTSVLKKIKLSLSGEGVNIVSTKAKQSCSPFTYLNLLFDEVTEMKYFE